MEFANKYYFYFVVVYSSNITRIPENHGAGNLILTVLAEDVDSGDRGIFEFYLGDQTSTTISGDPGVVGSTQYDLNATTGDLTAKLDSYTPDTYALEVCARDFGTPSLSSCVPYTIIIEPANNNPPTFQLTQVGPVLIPELTEETLYSSVPVFNIQVLDADLGMIFVYILFSSFFIVCLQVQLGKLMS